jgi:tetratricopeptide (TPR) repeat protein
MSNKAVDFSSMIRDLLAVSAPLRAREISRRLRATRNISIDASQVNSILYGTLSSEVERLADFSWRLRPSLACVQRTQKRTAHAGFEIELRKAIEYLKSANFRHCIDSCKKALSLHPKAAMPHCLAARAYVQLGSPKKAVMHFEKAIKLGPELGNRDLLALAMAYEQAGEPKQAGECFEQLIRKGANSRNIWRGYLHALRHSSQYEAALRVSCNALKAFPTDHEILWYRAVALEKLNRSNEAHRAYLLILRVAPNHERARACAHNLAAKLRKSGSVIPSQI